MNHSVHIFSRNSHIICKERTYTYTNIAAVLYIKSQIRQIFRVCYYFLDNGYKHKIRKETDFFMTIDIIYIYFVYIHHTHM